MARIGSSMGIAGGLALTGTAGQE